MKSKNDKRRERQTHIELGVMSCWFWFLWVELDLNRLKLFCPTKGRSLGETKQQCFSSLEMISVYSPHFRDWLIGITFGFGAGLRRRIIVDSHFLLTQSLLGFSLS